MLARRLLSRRSPIRCTAAGLLQQAGAHTEAEHAETRKPRSRDVKLPGPSRNPRTWSESAAHVDRLMADLARKDVQGGMSRPKGPQQASDAKLAAAQTTLQHLTKRDEAMWHNRTSQLIKERFSHKLQQGTDPLRRTHSSSSNAEGDA